MNQGTIGSQPDSTVTTPAKDASGQPFPTVPIQSQMVLPAGSVVQQSTVLIPNADGSFNSAVLPNVLNLAGTMGCQLLAGNQTVQQPVVYKQQPPQSGTSVVYNQQQVKPGTSVVYKQQPPQSGTSVVYMQQPSQSGTSVVYNQQQAKPGTSVVYMQQPPQSGTSVVYNQQQAKPATSVVYKQQPPHSGTSVVYNQQQAKPGTSVVYKQQPPHSGTSAVYNQTVSRPVVYRGQNPATQQLVYSAAANAPRNTSNMVCLNSSQINYVCNQGKLKTVFDIPTAANQYLPVVHSETPSVRSAVCQAPLLNSQNQLNRKVFTKPSDARNMLLVSSNQSKMVTNSAVSTPPATGIGHKVSYLVPPQASGGNSVMSVSHTRTNQLSRTPVYAPHAAKTNTSVAQSVNVVNQSGNQTNCYKLSLRQPGAPVSITSDRSVLSATPVVKKVPVSQATKSGTTYNISQNVPNTSVATQAGEVGSIDYLGRIRIKKNQIENTLGDSISGNASNEKGHSQPTHLKNIDNSALKNILQSVTINELLKGDASSQVKVSNTERPSACIRPNTHLLTTDSGILGDEQVENSGVQQFEAPSIHVHVPSDDSEIVVVYNANSIRNSVLTSQQQRIVGNKDHATVDPEQYQPPTSGEDSPYNPTPVSLVRTNVGIVETTDNVGWATEDTADQRDNDHSNQHIMSQPAISTNKYTGGVNNPKDIHIAALSTPTLNTPTSDMSNAVFGQDYGTETGSDENETECDVNDGYEIVVNMSDDSDASDCGDLSKMESDSDDGGPENCLVDVDKANNRSMMTLQNESDIDSIDEEISDDVSQASQLSSVSDDLMNMECQSVDSDSEREIPDHTTTNVENTISSNTQQNIASVNMQKIIEDTVETEINKINTNLKQDPEIKAEDDDDDVIYIPPAPIEIVTIESDSDDEDTEKSSSEANKVHAVIPPCVTGGLKNTSQLQGSTCSNSQGNRINDKLPITIQMSSTSNTCTSVSSSFTRATSSIKTSTQSLPGTTKPSAPTTVISALLKHSVQLSNIVTSTCSSSDKTAPSLITSINGSYYSLVKDSKGIHTLVPVNMSQSRPADIRPAGIITTRPNLSSFSLKQLIAKQQNFPKAPIRNLVPFSNVAPIPIRPVIVSCLNQSPSVSQSSVPVNLPVRTSIPKHLPFQFVASTTSVGETSVTTQPAVNTSSISTCSTLQKQDNMSNISSTLQKQDNTSSISSTLQKQVNTSSISSTLQKQVNMSSISSTLQKQVNTSSISSTLQKQVNTSSISSTLQKQVNTSSISSTLQNQVNTSSISSTLQKQVNTSSISSTLQKQVNTSSISSTLQKQTTVTSTSLVNQRPIVTPEQHSSLLLLSYLKQTNAKNLSEQTFSMRQQPNYDGAFHQFVGHADTPPTKGSSSKKDKPRKRKHPSSDTDSDVEEFNIGETTTGEKILPVRHEFMYSAIKPSSEKSGGRILASALTADPDSDDTDSDEKVILKSRKKCSAAKSCYVVMRKIGTKQDVVKASEWTAENCSLNCRKKYLKTLFRCTY